MSSVSLPLFFMTCQCVKITVNLLLSLYLEAVSHLVVNGGYITLSSSHLRSTAPRGAPCRLSGVSADKMFAQIRVNATVVKPKSRLSFFFFLY